MDAKPMKVPARHLVILIGAILLGVAVFFFNRRVTDEPVIEERPAENAAPAIDGGAVIQLRNLGIAQLENLEFDAAEASFQKLSALLPDERLAVQNLVVTHVLRIQPEHLDRFRDPAKFQSAISRAQSVVEAFLARYSREADAHVLAARLAEQLEQPERQLAELRAAATLKPDSAAIRFEVYDALKHSRIPGDSESAAQELALAWRLAPENLSLLGELLVNQAQKKNPAIVDTFEAAQKLVVPLQRKIEALTRTDTRQLLLDGQAAVKDGNWNVAARSAGQLANLLRPLVESQNDTKLVRRHLLDFVLHDFSPTVAEQIKASMSKSKEGIPVKLAAAPSQLPSLTDARAVRLIDFDLDGTLDVFVVESHRLTVFSPLKEGGWKAAVTFESTGELSGACLFDIDRDAVAPPLVTGPLEPNPDPDATRAKADAEKSKPVVAGGNPAPGSCYDADLDVVAWGPAGVIVLKNEASEDKSSRALLPMNAGEELAALREVLTALPVDFDHDGDLDLVVSSKSGLSLWQSREDFTFLDQTEYSLLPPADAGIHSMVAVDWDRNVAVDVLCAGSGRSGYLENILHGRLRWHDFENGPAAVSSSRGAGLAVLDADASVSWDVVAAGTSLKLFRTRNPDAGVVRFLETQALNAEAVEGLCLWDADNDGWQDVLSWRGKTLSTQRGGPNAEFTAATSLSVEAAEAITGCDIGDLDRDGDQDLAVVTNKGVELFLNEGGNANQWIDLPIRAEDSKQAQKPNERVNLHGVGSLIELRADSLWQPQVVTGRSTHFGLGQRTKADSVRVLWTNGIPEHLIESKSGEPICLQQHLKGSCPYLYGWDGEKFAFVTDCLWAAPIGLQIAEGRQLPGREWEYLKVEGRFLKAIDDEYRLRLTEELWEVGYFDAVRLMAVDHPAEVEVYSNEKVGPPDIAEFKVHTVRQRRSPVAARDQRGRDVLAKIAARDDDFTQCFDRRIKQGLTEPHFLELDAGSLNSVDEASKPQTDAGRNASRKSPRIMLFLTGWIRPTDTSLNIAISQRSDLEPTQPPSIQVPDQNGQWITVRPYMGFPGGKTKTIAIDLTGLFPANDYRVRIASTMELYWDEAFFTVDDQPAEVRLTELPLQSATLRYRGFSAIVPHTGLGPDGYDYRRATMTPKWPPLEGRLTTYGDVLPLIQGIDNQQALLGAGDELEVRFNATAAPDLPAGWTRDFILHNVGWDKDADLNTVFGQSVDPLPFAGMDGYPAFNTPQDDRAPSARQTRPQPRARFWRQLLNEAAQAETR